LPQLFIYKYTNLKLTYVSFSLTHNVWRLAEGGDFQHKISNEELKFIYPQNWLTKHETATFGKVLL